MWPQFAYSSPSGGAPIRFQIYYGVIVIPSCWRAVARGTGVVAAGGAVASEGGRGPQSDASTVAGLGVSGVEPAVFGVHAACGSLCPVPRPVLLHDACRGACVERRPAAFPVGTPIFGVLGRYGAPLLPGFPGSAPVVERVCSTTGTGIVPTVRRGATGPSWCATTPANCLP